MSPGRRVRLTSFASCAAERPRWVLRPWPRCCGHSHPCSTRRPRPICWPALGAADDAAVWRLRPDLAIVVTTDFFPPVVDDPATYGAIAVTNALSDIYAMGGQPLLGLNLVAFPEDLDPAILTEILRGGAEQAARAGAVIAGGHSIIDPEPKYGLAAIGVVHPDAIIRKSGAEVGDVLILTKPLGTGIITTALKRDVLAESSAEMQVAIASMTTLNAGALVVVLRLRDAGTLRLHAGTDVTGFGLLGHAWEMLSPRGQGLRLRVADLPLLPGARDLATRDVIPGGTSRNLATRDVTPGGTSRNLAAITPHARWGGNVTEADRALLADPQTAGGLLLAVAAMDAPALLAAFAAADIPAWQVATVTDSGMMEVE